MQRDGPVDPTATNDDAVRFTEILAGKLGRIMLDDAVQELGVPSGPQAVIADRLRPDRRCRRRR